MVHIVEVLTNHNYVLKCDLGHHTPIKVCVYLQGGTGLQAGPDLDWGLALTCLQIQSLSYFWALQSFQMLLGHLFLSKTTLTKYYPIQWISKLPMNFKIFWVSQYLVNSTGLVPIVTATVYNTEPIYHVSGMANCP